MITILFFLVTLVFFTKKDKKILLPSIISALALFIFHTFFLIEYHIGGISYFISDEQVYLNLEGAHKLNESAIKDRYLWFLLTGFISESDFTGGLFNKLISLPLIPAVIYFFKKITNDHRAVYLFAFLPYFLFIMQTALRDGLIVTISLAFIYLTSKKLKKTIFYLSILLILIFLLRPFYLALLLSSTFISYYIVNNVGESFVIKLRSGLLHLILITLVAIATYFIFKGKFDQYIRTLMYYYEFGLILDEGKSTVTPSFSLHYFFYAVVRFIFTPLPSSLLERIMSGDVTQFGYVDDIVRMINQIIVLSIIFYIIFNFRFVPGYLRELTRNFTQLSFLIFVALNTIIYSLYYAGGGHSRLKIVLFLGLLVFSLGVNRVKCQKKF